MKKTTLVNHPPEVTLPPGNRPVVAPIYQSVKFEFENLEDTLGFLHGERPGFFYSRSANPTTRQLELTLAALQGRDDCLVTSTGVGAIAQTLLVLTKQGDHVLCFTCTMLSIEDLEGIERVLRTQPTRLVVFESPTNPVNKVADIEAITRLASAHGALTVLDNTFAGFHQHGEYPLDLFVHSLTKYACGTGDVMGGAVIGRAEIIRSLRNEFGALGGMLDPHAAFLIQRGLKTYFVRYDAQTRTAQRLAEMLAGHAKVERVHYPGLPTHPGHALARKQMKDFGTMLTADLKGGSAAAARFADALQLFAITASFGATESLVVPPQMMSARDLTAEQARISAVTESTVRLSVGLEDAEELLEDVRQALAAA